jgi:hypothetical protein
MKTEDSRLQGSCCHLVPSANATDQRVEMAQVIVILGKNRNVISAPAASVCSSAISETDLSDTGELPFKDRIQFDKVFFHEASL